MKPRKYKNVTVGWCLARGYTDVLFEILRLEGECGHRIFVRFDPYGKDKNTIQEDLDQLCVFLERTCPLCRKKRRFKLDNSSEYQMDLDLCKRLDPFMVYKMRPSVEIIREKQSHDRVNQPRRMESPPELAARWFHEARAHQKRGEWKQAEKKFRECIDLCQYLHMTVERLHAKQELEKLLVAEVSYYEMFGIGFS